MSNIIGFFTISAMVVYYILIAVVTFTLFVIVLPIFIIGQIIYSIRTFYTEGKFRLI